MARGPRRGRRGPSHQLNVVAVVSLKFWLRTHSPPTVPAIGEVRLPCRALGRAARVGDEDVEFVGVARDAVYGCALRGDQPTDAPPAMPAIGEVRLPGGRVHASVGAHHEPCLLYTSPSPR